MILYLLLLLEPNLRKVCATLELIGPAEYCSVRELIPTALHNYRELRYTPCLAQAEFLPDHATCRRNQDWFETRICYIEKYRDLFGTYRWDDFEPGLESLRQARNYWNDAEIATGSGNFKGRRLALARLQ